MNWMAWAVQHQQPESALVFLGKRGSGRGTLGNAMVRIFGNHGLQINSPQHLVGRFNAHLRQCALLFADEAYAVADKSTEGKEADERAEALRAIVEPLKGESTRAIAAVLNERGIPTVR